VDSLPVHEWQRAAADGGGFRAGRRRRKLPKRDAVCVKWGGRSPNRRLGSVMSSTAMVKSMSSR